MKKVLFISIIVFTILQVVDAQNITPVDVPYFYSSAYNGRIIIEQDQSLKNFIETHVGLNKKRKGFPGYRVKIYSKNHQNARNEANSIKASFNQDGQEAYVVYNAPNFEVFVGDYQTRFEALALLNKIKSKYPQSFVVKSTITYPKR